MDKVKIISIGCGQRGYGQSILLAKIEDYDLVALCDKYLDKAERHLNKTFDEFFEILTLKQLGRHNKAIVILNTNGYYDNLLKMMEVSIEKQFITRDCVELYKVVDTVDEALDYIESYDPTDIDLSKVKIR